MTNKTITIPRTTTALKTQPSATSVTTALRPLADEKEVESTRRVYSSKIGKGPRDPDIPHRNELPKRDELPFREPAPEGPGFMEILAQLRGAGRNLPALPAPQPKPAGNSTAEKRVP